MCKILLKVFNLRVISVWSSNIFMPRDKKRTNSYKNYTYRKKLCKMDSEGSYRYYNNINKSDYNKILVEEYIMLGYPEKFKIKKGKIILV